MAGNDDERGLGWADQWDYKNDDALNGSHNESPSKSKLAAYNQKLKSAASSGFGKAKSAATVGARKVKSGTTTGVNWIKEKIAARKSRN